MGAYKEPHGGTLKELYLDAASAEAETDGAEDDLDTHGEASRVSRLASTVSLGSDSTRALKASKADGSLTPEERSVFEDTLKDLKLPAGTTAGGLIDGTYDADALISPTSAYRALMWVDNTGRTSLDGGADRQAVALLLRVNPKQHRQAV